MSGPACFRDFPNHPAGFVRIHLGGLYRLCSHCEKFLPLVEFFGQFRRMESDGNEYRTQPQCKKCRGRYRQEVKT